MYMLNAGLIAFLFGTFAFLPQALAVYRTNDTKSLSFDTLVMFLLSQIFWLMHSLQSHDITLGLTVSVNTIVYSYLVYKKYTNDMVDKTQRTAGSPESDKKGR